MCFPFSKMLCVFTVCVRARARAQWCLPWLFTSLLLKQGPSLNLELPNSCWANPPSLSRKTLSLTPECRGVTVGCHICRVSVTSGDPNPSLHSCGARAFSLDPSPQSYTAHFRIRTQWRGEKPAPSNHSGRAHDFNHKTKASTLLGPLLTLNEWQIYKKKGDLTNSRP